MLKTFEVLDPSLMVPTWWKKVKGFEEPRKWEFQPGLNILWGRNASGKTTLLKAIAAAFHAQQGGRSVVTRDSLRETFGSVWKPNLERLEKALKVEHDGQSVRYIDPSTKIGISHGAFDDDFFTEGVMSTVFRRHVAVSRSRSRSTKGSHGQTTLFRINSLGKALKEPMSEAVEYRVEAGVTDPWGPELRAVKAFLAPNIEMGPPTFILDEPERSLDLDFQAGLWRFLQGVDAKAIQIIVATHSTFAMDIPGANYIQISSEDYLAKCRRSRLDPEKVKTAIRGTMEEEIERQIVEGLAKSGITSEISKAEDGVALTIHHADRSTDTSKGRTAFAALLNQLTFHLS